LPGNIIAINYADGNRVTGGVTFNGEAVIGTGTSNTQSGLYLAPDPVSLTNDLYLRVRGNIIDEPTHIHFDTGNNQYFNQFIGDDNKYILLANTGNVVVNTNNNAGNSAQWNFSTNGTLTLPAGSSRITSYGQITIETDNNASGMYLNADGVNLLYANANVTLRANSIGTNKDWNFGNTGVLTVPAATGVPGQISAQTAANGRGYDLRISAGNTNGCSIAGGDMYLSAGAGYGGVGWNAGNVNIVTGDRYGNLTGNTWRFDALGNLNLPGNTFAVNYANGNPVTFTANTGNVTFNDQAVVGTGDQFGSSGLYLAPGTESMGNLQYWRVRGGDVATHMHLDTGNNAYFDQYFGDDGKYVKLTNTGNVQIGSNDAVGNSASWTFDTGGNLTFPTGNLVITPDDAAFGNSAVIASEDHNLITLSTGANGGLSSLWVEDLANATSNIAAVYANPTPGSGIVRIAVGPNGSPGPNLWDFDASGNLTVPGNIIMTAGIVGSGASLAPYLSGFSSLSAITVSASGNVIAGNITTAGLISATGNVSGGNLNVTGNIVDTGALSIITGSNGNIALAPNGTGIVTVSSNISSTGNITTAGNFVGNGAALTNVTVSVAGNIIGTQSNVTLVAGSYNWTFDNTGNLTLPGNTFSVNYANNTPVNAVTRFESAWTVPVGNSTQSFTVTANETYYMWVDCNIPNGILTWNATATVTNTNVPVVGAQYAWVYNGGGTPIDFTSIPNQFVGTANTIVRSNVAPSATTNRFDFGINNTSGASQTVRYGWIAIS
jgi:hypothetical protein